MNQDQNTKLVFVYNADSGLSNALLDYGKKYINPAGYNCQLCMVSFGAFGMKKDWQQFVASLPYKSEFLHKDEFATQYPSESVFFPSLLKEVDGKMQVLITSEQFKAITTLSMLIDTVKQKLK